MLAAHVLRRLVRLYLVLLQDLSLNDLAALLNELLALLLDRERAQVLAHLHALRRVVDQLERCILVEMHSRRDLRLGAKHAATVARGANKRSLRVLVVH